MMRRVCILIGLLLISGAASALTKSEVRKIIEDAYPGARITEIETETYRDQDVYEVDFRHDGKKLEAIISVDGEIIKVDIDD
ncbi:MAG: PepSY domain-containing protein [Gammaproteobacteria bacterium]|nr:PepSY domain-containing protein [Gammaproteobacteria bacterium]